MKKSSDIFTDFSKRFEGYAREAKRQKEEEALKKEKQKAYNEANNLIELPQWPEEKRGVPNCVLRGSLFAAIAERSARYCNDIVLHESEKVSIKYTGMRLTQSDLNVWEYALHLARKQYLGNKVYFTEHSFLMGLGKINSAVNYKWLDKTLKKLRATTIAVTHEKQTYIGGLIDEAYRDEKEGRYVIILNPKIHRLFEAGNTWISWEERKRIGHKKPLAQWLHGYISTHAKWMPHKIETIKNLSGSKTKELWKFKQNLVIALKHLKKLELIEEFLIDEKNLVYITRIPSNSQQKHLDTR